MMLENPCIMGRLRRIEQGNSVQLELASKAEVAPLIQGQDYLEASMAVFAVESSVYTILMHFRIFISEYLKPRLISQLKTLTVVQPCQFPGTGYILNLQTRQNSTKHQVSLATRAPLLPSSFAQHKHSIHQIRANATFAGQGDPWTHAKIPFYNTCWLQYTIT